MASGSAACGAAGMQALPSRAPAPRRTALAPWTQQTLDLFAAQLDLLDASPPPGAPPGGCRVAPEAGPLESDPGRGARVAVVTQASGPQYAAPELQAVLNSQRCYAARHGYDYIADAGELSERMGRGPRETFGWVHRAGDQGGEVPGVLPYSYKFWAKWLALASHLPRYDWVLWVDADVLVNNASYPLEALVGEGQQDVVFRNGPIGLNNGVLAMRNSCFSRRFLRDWWEDSKQDTWYTHLNSYDNGPFIHAVLRAANRDLDGSFDEDLCLGAADAWACMRANVPRGPDGMPFLWGGDGPANVSRHLRAVNGEPPGVNVQAWQIFDAGRLIQPEEFLIHFTGGGKNDTIRAWLGDRVEALLSETC